MYHGYGLEACLLVDGYGLLLQVIVSMLAMSTLLVKRHREQPQRPWLIWGFDTSKQFFAALAMHIINFMAFNLSGNSSSSIPPKSSTHADPCLWYFVCVMADTTLLVALLALLLRITDGLVGQFGLAALRHGEYGDPPQWQYWLMQLVLFVLLVLASKGVLLLLLYRNAALLMSAAAWMLALVRINAYLEVLLVMLLIPLSLSATQYWIIDQLLKADQITSWTREGPSYWAALPQSDPTDATGTIDKVDAIDAAGPSTTAIPHLHSEMERQEENRIYRTLLCSQGLGHVLDYGEDFADADDDDEEVCGKVVSGGWR